MDSLIACLIVGAAVVWAARLFVKSLKGEGDCGCSGCSGCTPEGQHSPDAQKDDAPAPGSAVEGDRRTPGGAAVGSAV